MPAKKAIVGRFERLIVMRVWWNVMSERRKITIISNASTHCYRHIVQEWLCSGFSIWGTGPRSKTIHEDCKTGSNCCEHCTESIIGLWRKSGHPYWSFVSKDDLSENQHVQVKIVCIYNDNLLPIPETSGFAQIP